ncbi:uncharacterized protein N0V89_008696 [Didymosphaeria variabile]|uniref:Uncharacterized protein n=1 Tax=Didymosphaeria variabile TaxID=1932322 RepID=A0A9W9C819_9PLEO|nr:uncharacterized protein N0V89_008696 [Didymosphaeria variabile]KAJ4350075.1 hypothetical protein N0V89_008696 [Didymosphaeria variabile]
MAPSTRRRTRATANSSPLVELKTEPKRRVTKTTKVKRPVKAPEPAPEPEPEHVVRSEEISDSKPPVSFIQAPLSVASFLKNPPSVLRDIYDLVKKLQAEVQELKKAKAPQTDIAHQADTAPQDDAAPSEAPLEAPAVIEEDRREAMDLLRLADQKREQNMALSQIDMRPFQLSTTAVSPVHATAQPASTPRANGTTPPAATPQSSTSFFGSVWSTLKSSVWSTPKTKPSRPSSNANSLAASSASTPIAPPVIGDFTMSLTPTPTPVGDNRGSSKVKRSSGRRQRAAIIKNVASSVPDPAEEEQATKWAENVLMQLLQDSSASAGEKRKRLEDGMTYGDLNHFNSKPWKPAASSFGLDDELMDHVDNTPDEPAPMWAILEHLRIEQQWKGAQPEQEDEANQPASKKRKTSNGANDSITSPKQSVVSLDYANSPFYNSGGKSTSLRDLHPRSCLDRPSVQQDSNIFKKSQQSAAQQNDSSTAFPTSFSVPDDSDDEEDFEDEPNTNGTTATPGAFSTWTQPPPPAPVMPHAELPGSVGPAPSVPSVEGHLVASPTVDRVEAQRAKALKFTPAKPSNLSHMSKPSPSLRSDAGNESMLANSPAPIFGFKASGAAAPSIFQSASATNGASLSKNEALTNGATPSQEKGLSNGTSPFQNTGFTNGNSLFQTKGMTDGGSPFQTKGMTNGGSPFQTKGMTNGGSPFQAKSASNDEFAVKSAGASLALPDYEFIPPDAEPLDLPLEIEADLDTYVPSAELQAKIEAMTGWDDPILEYDDELSNV